MLNMQTATKVILFLATVLLGTFTVYKTSVLNAQTSGSTLTGTFACLTSGNYTGFDAVAKSAQRQPNGQGVNQLFVWSIDANGTTGTLQGGINNQVVNYGLASATITNTAMPNTPAEFTITPNSPTQYMYKLVGQGDSDQVYYIALTNGGNTALMMQAPGNKQTVNGVCQKV